MRILGLDPSISSTGWGIIDVEGSRLSYKADGFIPTSNKLPLSERLHISSWIQASAFALRNTMLCKGRMLNGWRGRWGMWGTWSTSGKLGVQGGSAVAAKRQDS